MKNPTSFFFLLIVLAVCGFLLKSSTINWRWQSDNSTDSWKRQEFNQIVIASAVCGDRSVDEVLVLIKSAIYFSNVPIKFILFADQFALQTIQQIATAKQWPENHQFDLRPLQFPKNQFNQWKDLYKICSSQKLFLPVKIN